MVDITPVSKTSTKKLKFKDLVISKDFNGEIIPVTTTLKIAEIFGKRHDHVLRDVENLEKNSNGDLLKFGEIFYKDSYERDQPMYLLDELFTTVLLMGFTGLDAIKWKIAYTKEFMRMRKQIAKATRIIRTRFDEPSDLNRTLNDILLRVRTQMGKETKEHHYIAMAENINEIVFGERGKGKLLRQNMNLQEYQRLNQALRTYIGGILDGHLHKKELVEFVEHKLILTKKKYIT